MLWELTMVVLMNWGLPKLDTRLHYSSHTHHAYHALKKACPPFIPINTHIRQFIIRIKQIMPAPAAPTCPVIPPHQAPQVRQCGSFFHPSPATHPLGVSFSGKNFSIFGNGRSSCGLSMLLELSIFGQWPLRSFSCGVCLFIYVPRTFYLWQWPHSPLCWTVYIHCHGLGKTL